MVLLFRKIFFVSARVLLDFRPMDQSVVFCLLFFVALILHVFSAPYAAVSHDRLEFSMLCAQFIGGFTALLLATTSGLSHSAKLALAGINVTLMVLVIISTFVCVVSDGRKLFAKRKIRKSDLRGCEQCMDATLLNEILQ